MTYDSFTLAYVRHGRECALNCAVLYRVPLTTALAWTRRVITHGYIA
jgi:hypothetical protein